MAPNRYTSFANSLHSSFRPFYYSIFHLHARSAPQSGEWGPLSLFFIPLTTWPFHPTLLHYNAFPSPHSSPKSTVQSKPMTNTSQPRRIFNANMYEGYIYAIGYTPFINLNRTSKDTGCNPKQIVLSNVLYKFNRWFSSCDFSYDDCFQNGHIIGCLAHDFLWREWGKVLHCSSSTVCKLKWQDWTMIHCLYYFSLL